MTRSCPPLLELAMWLDRESGQRCAAEIGDHVVACPACTREIDALARVVTELRVPAAAPVAPAAIRAVMAQLDAPVARVPIRAWAAGLGLAAAAAVLVAVVWRPPADPELQARGGISEHDLARRVGTVLYALRPDGQGSGGPVAIALAPGDAVHRDTGLVLAARNLERARPLWLMSFAVDAAGDVHWLYPGYASASDDPISPLLPPGEREAMLPDSVILDRPALGRLRVIVIVSPVSLRVSAIEHRSAAELELPALRQQLPCAEITELLLQVVP